MNRRAQVLKKDGDVNGPCNYEITQMERKRREKQETIKVVDKESAQ